MHRAQCIEQMTLDYAVICFTKQLQIALTASAARTICEVLRNCVRAASDHMVKPTLTVPSHENSESPAGKADTPGSALDISDMSSDCRRCVTA